MGSGGSRSTGVGNAARVETNGALPAGPGDGVLAQTVALHRDPLETLRSARSEHGDVFTMRLATARPIVVMADPAAVETVLVADPGTARAGEARRRILPMASPRSVFGGDGAQHGGARRRVAAMFTPDAVNERRAAMEAIAVRHVARWPRRRPLRLLPRMRALVDEVFVETILGVRDQQRKTALTVAIRRMLWTPGNPPLSIPGEGDGLLGAAGAALFRRRRAPLARLLGEEIDSRGAHARDDDVIGSMLRGDPAAPTEAMVDELIPLLMAAQEPAASALTWLLDRLARERLAERFAATQDGDRLADAVVRETLRLRPAAIAALRRLTVAGNVAGHALPAGATVMLPIPLLHRDPQAFPEPDDFRPARWMDRPEPAAPFLPFGGGARRCLGEHLAQGYIASLVRPILRRVELQPLLPRPERMVLRGTILVPLRSTPVRVRSLAS
jgi:cytochrome P450 family 135